GRGRGRGATWQGAVGNCCRSSAKPSRRGSSLTIEKCACFHSVSVMPITLNQLSSFLAVAREGSVSGAAGKLYVTQPSISAAVSALSRELQVDLTERVGRGIGITAAGEAFRPHAADVLGLI